MADVNQNAEYIWRRARELGIKPATALGVARSEGLVPSVLNSSTYGNRDAGGYSFGPWQLHSGSSDPSKISSGGMASSFVKKYGEPPSASNWRQQTDFALEHAAKSGWGNWHAVKNRGGIGNITAIGEKFAAQLGLSDGPSQAVAPGLGGQLAQFVFGKPARSPDAFASDTQAGRAEPFSVGFDTARPYQPEFIKPEQQYGAAFAGSAPDMSGGSATLTSLPPTIDAAAAGGMGNIAGALASLGGALSKAGAAREDMSWVQKELQPHRGKWDDEIFKRSPFGIRGLLG